MLPIDFDTNGYNIRNIDSNDLENVLSCVNSTSAEERLYGGYETFTIEDIKLRYAETLLSSLEFFCGIFYKKDVAGIIKGRIESNGISGEVWFISYLILTKYCNEGLESIVINEFERYIKEKLNINYFYAIEMGENKKSQNFWIDNGYKIKRITKGNTNNDEIGLVVYEKIIK